MERVDKKRELREQIKKTFALKIESIKNNHKDVKLYGDYGLVLMFIPKDYYEVNDFDYENLPDPPPDDIIKQLRPFTSYGFNVEHSEERIKTTYSPDQVNISSLAELNKNRYLEVIDNICVNRKSIYKSTLNNIKSYIQEKLELLEGIGFNKGYFVYVAFININSFKYCFGDDLLHEILIKEKDIISFTEVDDSKPFVNKVKNLFVPILTKFGIPEDKIIEIITYLEN